MKYKETKIKNLRQLNIFAKEFLQKILSSEKKGARVVGLIGSLGVGKTTFVQLLLKDLGIKEQILSPSFLIIKSYEINPKMRSRIKDSAFAKATADKQGLRIFHRVFHIDAYRLNSEKELLALGWEEIISNPHHLILIEWADKVKKILPKNSFQLQFSFGEKKNERAISTSPSRLISKAS